MLEPWLLSTAFHVELTKSRFLSAFQTTGFRSPQALLNAALRAEKSPQFVREPKWREHLLSADLHDECDARRLAARFSVECLGAIAPELNLRGIDPMLCDAAAVYLSHEAHQRSARGSEWNWRSNNRLNAIAYHTHGDVSFSQRELPESELLFPDLVSPTSVYRAFTLPQDASPLLLSLLLYADYLGLREIESVTNYREIVAKERVNSWGNPDYQRSGRNQRLFGSGELQVTLGGCGGDESRALRFATRSCTFITPLIRDNALFFEVQAATETGLTRTNTSILWPEDLPDALRGVYRAFARDPDRMAFLMECFNRGELRAR